jgi:hypothetical protein
LRCRKGKIRWSACILSSRKVRARVRVKVRVKVRVRVRKGY